MGLWMNEWEVQEAVARFGRGDTPNLAHAARILDRLVNWTNNHSDGWPYWRKPAAAANRLMLLLSGVDRWDPVDVTEADVRKACVPIRAFFTRQGVDSALVLGN